MERITDEQVRRYSTPAVHLRYKFKHDLGSDGEFEFRRQELAHIMDRRLEDITDQLLVRSYLESLAEGGYLRDYLAQAKMAVLLGGTLFVHGQIIVDSSPTGPAWAVTRCQTRGAADHLASRWSN